MKSPSSDHYQTIPLEDQFEDIIGKAQRGLGLSDDAMIKSLEISRAMWSEIKQGAPPEKTLVSRIATCLNLDAAKLLQSIRQSWYPEVRLVDGLFISNTPYKDMWVNSYLVWDLEAKEGAIFDTGSSIDAIVYKARKMELTIPSIFITHTHTDHIVALDALRKEFPETRVYVSSKEPLKQAELISEGQQFAIGALRVKTLLTWGHSPGALSYLIHGLASDIAIVGDAMFAGSMGGGMVSYADALRTNREQILSLSDQTILCPGHGPPTTVGLEKANNPFF